MIEYACSKCGAAMSSPDSLVGQEERCPECGSTTKVPQPSTALATGAASDHQSAPPFMPVLGQVSRSIAQAGCRRDPLISKVVTLAAYTVAAIGLGFGNYTYYAYGAGHDRSGDRYGFVGWTVLGIIYVVGSFFSRWAAIGSCAVAVLGFLMFITYPVNLSFSRFWGQTLAMVAYLAAFIGSVAVIVTGRKKTPAPDADLVAQTRRKTSGLAILSLVFSCIPHPLTTIPGVILGHLARWRIRKRPDTRKGLHLASAGLFLGYVFLGLFAVLAVIIVLAQL